MPVVRAVATRGLQIVVVALLVTIGTAVLVRLVPGDPATAILGDKASPETVSALRAELGTDRPLVEQVGSSLGDLAQGDLGTSFTQRGREVSSIVIPSLGVTASLVLVAIVFSIALGVPTGLMLALARRRGTDLAGRLGLTILLAVPAFVGGLILLYAGALQLGIAPPGGWAGTWPANFEYVWLPALALTAYLGSLIARAVRQAALQTMAQPFVEAARSRGIPRSRIIWRHILPNALLPVITLVGFNAGVLLSGAVTVEVVFALPGVGAEIVEAMDVRDLPIVQGIALITAAAIVLFNLLVDLLYIAVDPRIRHSR